MSAQNRARGREGDRDYWEFAIGQRSDAWYFGCGHGGCKSREPDKDKGNQTALVESGVCRSGFRALRPSSLNGVTDRDVPKSLSCRVVCVWREHRARSLRRSWHHRGK